MTKTRRARIDAENGHRRIARSRLRIIEAEVQGFPTGYLRSQSERFECDRGSRKVGYDEAIILDGLWIIVHARAHSGAARRAVFFGMVNYK